MAKEFVHLHVHTEFSLLDGAARVRNLIAAAKNMGASAIAITDHGGMYGVIDFYEAAAREKIKPIIGCEVYVAPKSRLDKTAGVKDNSAGGGPARGGPYHLILLAENNEGYRNLMHLVTLSYMEGFYYRPRVDKELLRRYSSGLIALSGCLKGEISQALLNGGTEKAKKLASEYENIFGKGNFFIEVQDQKMEEQKELNENLVKIARDLEIPIVATNDVHYIKKEESTAQDVLLCIQTGSVLESDDRLKFSTDEFYLKNPEQMRRLFSHLPEALDNTLAIAERCSVSIDFNRVYLPNYEVPDGYDLDSYLEKLCREGLKERYEKITPGIEERLKHELEVIKGKGFSGYFLVVWDFVRHAKSKGIAVGPGRGSAAGSLVAYSLGITNIDPLKYGLLFERFLNPERKSLPDIDIDFDEERRDEVIDYVVKKYGRDRVAQIVTFGTMAARAATRDAGRVFNIPYSRVDKIAKLIPEVLDITVDQALNTVPELRQEYETDEKVRQILDTAKVLEGLARHDSIHAAGVVISRDELPNYTPLQRKGEGEVVTQYHMKAVQKIGLLKMDFLGLRTLTVIEKALKIIKGIHGVEIDMDNLPLSDEKTYRMLRKGDSVGVFQLESSGMRGLLKELRPTRFEDIIALLALHRPGPLGSGMVQDFMDRKHGRKKIDYLHPSLKPILEDTYGIIVYQEQVMRIASEMAGFSLAEADILRGAMSKKKHDVMAEQREKFIGGAISKGYDANLASRIFDLVTHFGGYGFNKCLIGETELIDADTGEIVTVEKLFKRKKLVNTLSCDSDLKMIKRPIIDVVANGVKPVYRVKTQLGREIVVTDNHPFLTVDGWRELRDLFEGERVALPRILPIEGHKVWDDYKLIVLAGVLAEGNTCHPSGFYYYNNEIEQIKDFVVSVQKFENTKPRTNRRRGGHEVYVGTGQNRRFKKGQSPWNKGLTKSEYGWEKRNSNAARSGARLWIEKLGLANKKSTEKFIPPEVFELTRDNTALFIGRLWSGDGHLGVSKAPRGSAIIFYATSSKKLAQQLQHLLLRLGIVSRLHEKVFKYRGRTRPGYAVYIQGRESALRFLEQVSPFMINRSVQIDMLQRYYASVAAHRESKDVIPARIKYLIQAEKQALGEIWPEVEFSSNISTRELSGTVKSYKHDFRRKTIGALATYFDSDELRRYASSDIYWDEVVSIEYAGEKPTYDIEVADTHNFVANGIIVHNSHSTAYASISYQTSYLKANYPVEFMAALLTSVQGSKDKVAQYVNECRQLGIKVLPPDVNQSYQDFTVVEGAIRFGLSAVRNVGDNVIEAIIEGRREGEFKFLHDFCRRVNLKVINKRAVESLIKAGAFDFAGTRKHLLSIFEKAMDSGSKVQQDRKIGQFSLFGEEDRMSVVAKEEKEEFPKDQLLSYEKEMLGLYVSDHPLLSVESKLKSQTDVVLSELADQKDGAIRWVGGIVSRASRTLTKKGEMMLFLTLEDLEGSVEVVIFPSTYQRYRDLLAKDNIVLIKGRVDVKEDGFKVIAQDIKPLDLREEASRPLSLRLTQNGLSSRLIDQLKAILKSHSGPSPVILHIQAGAKLTQLELGNEYRVKRSGALYAELKALLGEKSVIN